MFEHKRAAGLGVALGADHVLIGGRPELSVIEGAMRIVAVSALHQTFIHLVMEGLAEGRLNVGVTAEAQLRLRRPEKVRILARQIEQGCVPLQRIAYARIGL